jgi:hypothetical protein
MVQVYATFIYMVHTHMWDIHMEYTFIAHTYAEYFRYLNVKSPYLFCTHVAPCIICY